ncbi:DUF6603 domain-containing protein [Actinosynnema sp. NPDC059335]|uniref:DUF6603 domain-containing protein n=1 Tax=Actinosynnema sp. NPDC059335 TaxID=3346804 RepID=UPI0036705020
MSEAEQSDDTEAQDKKDEKDETGVLVEKVKAGDTPVTELTDYLDLADVKSFDVKLTGVALEKVTDSQGRTGYLLLGDVGQKEQATTGRLLICSLYLPVEEGSDANPILFIAELDASTLFKEIPFADFLGLDDPGLVRLQVIALARHALKTDKEVDGFNKAIQEKLSGKTKSAPPTLMKKAPDKKLGGAVWEPGVYLALGTSLGKEDVPGLTLRLKKLAKSEPTTAAEESPKANARRWPIRGYGLKYLPEIPAADGVPGAPALVRMTIDAGFAYGPLGLEIIGFGLQVPFKTSDLVDFVTLTGIGVRADFAGFTVDGAVMWDQDARRRGIWKFDGLLAVTIPELLTFVLAGSYAQVSNPGEPTYNSLFVFISLSDFVLPLGPVTITGFMLGGGFNSLLRMPKIDDIENFPFVSGLKSGRVLPPKNGEKADKQESAAEVLKKLSSADESGWVSPCDGRHWAAGGLKLQLCEVVKCDALLVVEFGHGVAVVLLGVVKFEPLPKQDDKPSKLEIVKLVVQFEIGYDFDRHLLLCAFALTQDCFLLTKECKLSGGGALYVYTGGPSGGQWVLALGGYNPGFKVPKSYPKVPRIALEASLCDSVLIRGEFYFAKTTDGIMAGMACSISEDGGWWRWWCSLHWDLWAEWHSFSLRFDVGVSLGISASINLGLFRVPVSIEIGVDISLWWLPEHGGHCEAHLWGLSIGGGWGVSWPETKERPKVPWTKFTRQLPKAVKVVRKKGVERGEPKDETTHLSAVVAAGEAPGGGKPGDGGTATVPDQPWVFS